MLQRLTHAAISFALVVAVYQVYVAVAVPFLEPQWSGRAVSKSSASGQPVRARAAPHKYRKLLAAYFPADHWSLQKPPKTFENGRAMIVLDDYHPQDNGQVRVDRLVILFFPQRRDLGSAPPRDAIVLEAPAGAVLQMDKSLRSGPTTGAKLQWGKLPGKIVIRSDMRAPGPQDDFYLVTRDLQITEQMIRTDAEVDLRIGPHRGHGRQLELRLLPSDQAGSGLSIGGIESLEISHDVAAVVALENGLGGGFGTEPSSPVARVSGSPTELDDFGRHEPESPIRVTCQGPFRFDFASYIGSFTEQVCVVQTQASGLRDEIHGDELSFFFALDRPGQARADQNDKKLPLSGIHPAMVEVKGRPVRIDAPGREVTVRCERMRLEIGPRRVTFDGQDEVMLQYRDSEIHAPMVQYQHPPEGSSDRLGTLLATGNGWLRVGNDPQRAQEPIEVQWSESMRLGREDGQPVLTLEGRPKMTMVGLGQMWADEVKLYLREQAAGSNRLPAEVVPERVLAEGLVAIESAELTVRVHHLAVWIDYDSPQPNGSELQLGSPEGGGTGPLQNRLGGGGSGSQRSYDIVGDRLRLQVAVRNRRAVATTVSVDGRVKFREKPEQGDSAEPLLIEAGQLRIEKADTPAAQIEILAASTLSGQSAATAQVSVRGMTIRAAALELNRATSRVWIGSPGELELLVDRDLQGNPVAVAQPMTISWQKSMELDQDHITFLRNVLVVGNGGRLETARLIARLSVPVRFDGALRKQQPELVKLECWDGVTAIFQQQDAGGLVSHQRLELQSLAVNRQTGQLEGDGPGWIESVHLATGNRLMASGSENRQPGGPGAARGPVRIQGPVQRLRYLRIDFVRGIRGNLLRREIHALGQVKAIYGPVDSWQQRLQRSLQEGPGEHTIWISCDQLGVFESPMARPRQLDRVGGHRGALELVAQGQVIIEGKVPEQGAFTARADRATYDQLKTMFVLEGDPATLTRQPFVGGPPSESSAQKLIYRQATGEMKIEGLKRLQWNQFDMGRKQPQGTPR